MYCMLHIVSLLVGHRFLDSHFELIYSMRIVHTVACGCRSWTWVMKLLWTLLTVGHDVTGAYIGTSYA